MIALFVHQGPFRVASELELNGGRKKGECVCVCVRERESERERERSFGGARHRMRVKAREREREILMSGRVRESSIAKEKESTLESETKREKNMKDGKRLRE